MRCGGAHECPRLRKANAAFRQKNALETLNSFPVWSETFVAVEREDVYGGYIRKHQEFFLEGRHLELAALQLPVAGASPTVLKGL
jgi:hypothetical protein